MKRLKNLYASCDGSIAKWLKKHYWFAFCFGISLLIGTETWVIVVGGFGMWGAMNWQLALSVLVSVLALTFLGFKLCMSALLHHMLS
ncbi:MAG: hypothetical protein M0P64_04360 [Candidatus Pacebacteria bacterium]|nr:hypothetical protein [Candidatus Paceibacterota bacterium]